MLSLVTKPCAFCRKRTNDELNLGEFLRSKDLHLHYFCIVSKSQPKSVSYLLNQHLIVVQLLSSTIAQRGRDNQGLYGFMHKDILTEIERARHKVCCYCKRPGANLRCMHRNKQMNPCKKYFHLPCGNAKGAMHSFSKFHSHCHLHTKRTNLPSQHLRGLAQLDCIICYDGFAQDGRNAIFAECCNRDVVMHSQCLRVNFLL